MPHDGHMLQLQEKLSANVWVHRHQACHTVCFMHAPHCTTCTTACVHLSERLHTHACMQKIMVVFTLADAIGYCEDLHTALPTVYNWRETDRALGPHGGVLPAGG